MKKIITISREFGSGGRSIGKAVAERLGYAYYDKEIIEQTAEKTGFSQEFVENNGELAQGKNIFSYAFVGRNVYGESADDVIWKKQREIIKEMAEKGNCVIVGRCADYILRGRSDTLNVFIHSTMEKRAKRIVELYGETPQKPEKRLRDMDKMRSVNYKYYTDRTWGMSQNYDISLNSGEVGMNKCVDLICDLAKNL